MGIKMGGAASRAGRDSIVLDLTEEMGLGNSTGANGMTTIDRGRGGWVTPAATALLTVNQGAISTAFEAAIGRTVRLYTSGAAAVGLGSLTYKADVSPRFSVAGAAPPAILPPLLQQTFSMPCRRTVAGTAKFQIGFALNPANMLDILGTDAAAVWESVPGVFGGAWYPRVRFVAGGAITDGPSSGVLPADWHTPAIRYVPGAIPRLEWLLDGTPRFSLAGDANMLALHTALPGGYRMAAATGTPIGSTWQSLGARFLVEEV